MAASRKQGISRYLGSLTMWQEEQCCLVGLTKSLQDDVQNLVEQASDRILQLRGRTVVCKTLKGYRHKKDTSIGATQKAEFSCQADAQENLKPVVVDLDSSPSNVLGIRKQPQQPESVHAGGQEEQETEAVQPESNSTHAGQKRGRGQNGGKSQAKSKRVKAQATLLTSAKQLDAAGALGSRGSQQSAGGPSKAANSTDGVDAAEAAVESQPTAEATFVQAKKMAADERAPSTRRRQAKKKDTEKPSSNAQMHVVAGQSKTVVEVSGAPASPAVSARVTRSRRAQPGVIKTHASPLPDNKQRAGRSTRHKRNMMAAQLGSPGMHPKTKTATESGAVVPPAAAANVSGMTAAVGIDSAAEPTHASVRVSVPGREPAPEHAIKGGQPCAIVNAREMDPGKVETTAARENETDAASLMCETCTTPLSLTAVIKQHKAGQTEGGSSDMTRRPVDVGTTTSDTVKNICEQISGQERSLPVLTENAALVKQPIAAQPITAPPDNVRRMGAHIAATIAIFSGRGGPSLLGSDASDPPNDAGDPPDAKGTRDPASTEHVRRTMPAVDPSKIAYPPEENFSFGTKPKEQSSPILPRFGPTVEQSSVVSAIRTKAVMPGDTVGMKESLINAEVPNVSEVDNASATTAPDVEPSGRVEAVAKPELHVEHTAAESSNADMADPDDGLASRAGPEKGETGQGQEASTRGDVRNRSLSLSLAIQSPIFSAPTPARDPQRTSAGDVEPDTIGSDRETDSKATQPQSGQAQYLSKAADDDLGPADQEASMYGVSGQQEQVSARNAAMNEDSEDMQGGKATETCKSDDGEINELEDCEGSGAGPSASNAPVMSVKAVKADDAQSRLNGECSVAAVPVQLSKPKGSNLVSALRSFLPQRTAPSPTPAAGKKPVKVKALEAAQAAKQKEAARQAERALARAAAAERQRPGQVDVGPGNTKPSTQLQGPARLTPTKSVRITPTKSMKLTPTRTEGQRGTDAPAESIKTTGTVPSRVAVATSTTVPEEKRNDCPPCGAPAAGAGSVLAKAAFFQLKEEQSRKLAADLAAGRKVPVGTSTGALVMAQGASVPSYKSGANARTAIAGGDNEGATNAAVATTVMPPSAANPNPLAATSSRGVNAAAAPAETVTDKHKRVEAKRREEEERRRAELEARTKAKDDKLRNIEAAKQQQRQGGGGAPRPPPPLIPNPFAVQPLGKRPQLDAFGTGAGPAGAFQLKTEAESNKVGTVGLSATRTPVPKLAAAKTPGPKAGPVASSMVSPAVQMQVKLLPAVHAQGPAVDGTKVGGCAPGLPKPRPAGGAQAKQMQGAALGAAAADSQAEKENNATPGAGDLTEEERRNVHEIQTSPYVMQVKPRTPGAPSSTKPTYTNYEISPYRSDSDSNASEDEDNGRRRKPAATWAAREKIMFGVRAQLGINPVTIFGTFPSTIDLVKVFSDMPHPGKIDARGRPRRDYTRRGSSGIWDADAI